MGCDFAVHFIQEQLSLFNIFSFEGIGSKAANQQNCFRSKLELKDFSLQ